MFMDADCAPAINPEEMFNHKDILKTGSLFFSDVGRHHQGSWAYVYCGLKRMEKEWESGQFIVDKQRAWMGLRWAYWMCEHSDAWFKLGHGDKLTWELGMRVSNSPHLVSLDSRWEGWGIGQYWAGKLWFQHQMGAKRGEHPMLPYMAALFEEWRALYAP